MAINTARFTDDRFLTGYYEAVWVAFRDCGLCWTAMRDKDESLRFTRLRGYFRRNVTPFWRRMNYLTGDDTILNNPIIGEKECKQWRT